VSNPDTNLAGVDVGTAIIASHTFFVGKNQYDLSTVQYVYLALSVFALLVNVGIYFSTLPEVAQINTADLGAEKTTIRGFVKNTHCILGASKSCRSSLRFRSDLTVASQFFYVGAQVAVASFALFYITEQPGISPAISAAIASNMFSGCQGCFAIGRVFALVYLRYVDPGFVLFLNGIGACVSTILAASLDGKAGIACLFLIFLFES
jgi:FHS family L-fucose permease-like MFS transporter